MSATLASIGAAADALEGQLAALKILDGNAGQWPGVTEAAEALRAAAEAAAAEAQREALAAQQAVATAGQDHADAEASRADAGEARAQARAAEERAEAARADAASARQERDAARAEASDLAEALEVTRQQLADEEARSGELEKQLAYSEGELEGLRQAAAEAAAAAKAAEEESERCRAAVDASAAVASSGQERVEELLEERARLDSELEAARKRDQVHAAQVAALKKSLGDATNASASSTARWSKDLEATQIKLAAALERATKAEERAEHFAFEADKSNAAALAAANTTERLRREDADKVKRWGETVAGLREAQGGHKAEIAKLKVELSTAQKAASEAVTVRKERDDHSLRIKALAIDLRSSRADEQRVAADAESLKVALDRAQSESSAAAKRWNEEIDALRATCADATKRASLAEEALASQRSAAKKANLEAHAKSKALASMQTDVASTTKRWSTDVSRLKAALKAAEAKGDTATAEAMRSMEAEKEALRAKEAAEQALALAQAANAQATRRWHADVRRAKDDTAKKTASVAGLEAELAAAAKTLSQAEADKVKSLLQAETGKEAALGKLKADIEMLKGALARQHSDHAVSVKRWGDDVERLKRELASARGEVTDAEKRVAAAQHAMRQAGDSRAAKERALTQVQAESAAAIKRWSGENVALKKKLAAAETSLARQRQLAAAADKKAATATSGFEKVKQAHEEATSTAAARTARWGKEVHSAKAQVAGLRERLSSAERERDALREAASELRARLAASDQAKASAQDTQVSASAQWSEQLSQATGRCASLESQLKAYTAEAKERDYELKVAKEALAARDRELANERAVAEGLMVDMRAEQAKVSALQSELREQAAEARVHAARYERDAAVQAAMAGSWERELAKSEAERRAMRERVDRAEAEMAEFRRVATKGIEAAAVTHMHAARGRTPGSAKWHSKPQRAEKGAQPLAVADANAMAGVGGAKGRLNTKGAQAGANAAWADDGDDWGNAAMVSLASTRDAILPPIQEARARDPAVTAAARRRPARRVSSAPSEARRFGYQRGGLTPSLPPEEPLQPRWK